MMQDIGGLPDLIEVIRIQDSGPTEAARAIRKKLYATGSWTLTILTWGLVSMETSIANSGR